MTKPHGRARIAFISASALTALVVLTAAPASAGPLDPQFKTQRVYFHCSAPTPVGNVNLVADGSIPGWDTSAPSSVTGGEGCTTADANGVVVVVNPQENPTDGVWRGTFTGNLNTLTVNAHCMFCVGTARADGAATLGVRLNIDGEAITGDGGDSHDVQVVEENSGITQLYEFSVTDIAFVEPNLDTNGDGIGDNPFGSVEHTITLTLDGYDVGTNTFGQWVYDTSEVDSGITFNPASLAATRIPRS
ncbi:MAG: hypothetical protein ACRDH9_13645 [Actinomycetota bacterium]